MNQSTWRNQPQPVMLKCLKIVETIADTEVVVQFQTSEGHFTSFVPKHNVDRERKALQALIVADNEEGYIIQIPQETITSGRWLNLKKDELAERLIQYNWVKEQTNGT